MESLGVEIAPFGIHTTVVNPGFFRTELLTDQSTSFAAPFIADYDERRGPLVEYWKAQNGKQVGGPAKLARAADDREPGAWWRRSKTRPVRRSESRPPEGRSF
jgi:NAD(P)-dependent dehydrogenase (short-subunit alcohol dehydrogenase family)